MTVGGFSIRNPVFLNILMITLLILGAISVTRMPKEQFTEVPFYWVNITVPFPGVSSEDVEQLVTIPIENEMSGLDKLKEIQSISDEGLSIISIRFETDITENKFDKLYQDVQTRFNKAELPIDVLKETIKPFSTNDFSPTIEVIIYGNTNYKSLIETAEMIADDLETIPEVSKVSEIGARERILIVDINQEKLESKQLSLNSVVSSLSANNTNIPGGTISTNTKDYLIRTVGEIESIEEFNNINITKGIKIRDIGSVSEEYKDDSFARFNRENAIILRVSKIPKGNSVKIVAEVKEYISNWRNQLPEGLKISVINDSTIQIKSSLDVLLNNAILGLVFLILILFFFVGLRNALITSLGIPLSLAITFIVLDISGETFNSNTLFGLVLVIGLIVDHAIVITENSFRLQQSGLSRKKSAIEGVNQVVLPIIAASGTTVAAFLPLMILPGTIGKFLRVIPLTVSIAIIASTFEAIFFLPSHYYDWPGNRNKKKTGRGFKHLSVRYKKIISLLYKKKKMTVAFAVVLMLSILALTSTLRQDLFSAEDFTHFYINIEMPSGTTRSKTDQVVRQYEDIIYPLIGNGEVVAINSSVGFASSQSDNLKQGNMAQIFVDLTERDEGRDRQISEIMKEIKKSTNFIAGPENVFFKKAVNGPPQDPPLSFRLYGDNLKNLQDISNEIVDLLRQEPNLLNIQNDFGDGASELKVVIDQEKAINYDLTILDIGQFIRASIDGITATTYVKNNKSIDVVIKLNNDNPIDIYGLFQLFIPTTGGKKIPFSAVAEIIETNGIGQIRRVDGKRLVTISSDAYDKSDIPEINSKINKYITTKYIDTSPDLELVIGGEFAEFDTLLTQILQIFLIGIFLIYLILGSQFKSYIQPFLILFSIPMAFAGVILFLFISRTPFSTTVMYAAVALAGIAVNDAIVLISFINKLRRRGKKVKQAVLEASHTRLRPILLTSLTTIAGLTPTAIGLGGKSVVWQPMAYTIIFGLLFSTLAALILIPCLYGLLFDKR